MNKKARLTREAPEQATYGEECACEICRYKLPFDMPAHLVDDCINGRAIIFAGAGVSTEDPLVLKDSLYAVLQSELGLKDTSLTFPSVAQLIESEPNGRIRLLSKIQERIDYITSFPELYRDATRFHRELATFWPLDTIVTTNWDDFFERECAAVPFVQPEDVAFWELAKRRVLKIHGTVRSYGSIVASEEDYRNAKRRLTKNLIGSQLKLLLATRSVIFVGYSLRDDDFRFVYSLVAREMNRLKRQGYIVTPRASADERDRIRECNLILIETDGTHFVEVLKEHAKAKICMLPDEVYSDAKALLSDVAEAHDFLCADIKWSKYPSVMYCAAYQDGLIHGLQRIVNLRSTGQYSDRHRAYNLARNYIDMRDLRSRQRRYEDVAYIDGYLAALWFLAFYGSDEIDNIPDFYYAFGIDKTIGTHKEFKRALPLLATAHKAAHKRALRFWEKISHNDRSDIVFHHRVAV